MKARHVTSEREYRDPFGAVRLGGAVTVGIDVWDDEVVFCTLRTWTDGVGERLLEMHGEKRGGVTHFSVTFTPDRTGIIWYSFDIEASDGAVWRYGAQPGWTTGEGAFAYGDPPSFQITVYKQRAIQPNWYRGGIVYQVFPDRFARGEDWRHRADVAMERPHIAGPGRAVVDDWSTPPAYDKDENGRIKRWDFYGGTLEGVREKLRYLKDLGVTVIYLNPIFEAASNHRYDTGDYMAIDPMLGDEESFRRLCVDAEEMGISVILDGVFNHTGCDSRYFNKYGNYPDSVGAYQSTDSVYRSSYTFHDDGTYDSWWGVDDLPAINENDPSYHEFICGREGVVRRWLRDGARGWRLDVADELPDSFIADIKHAVLAEKPDGLLIGEVWEDASNKTAYGSLRQYFEGSELDGTMNYPLREGLLAFMRNEIGAQELTRRLEQLGENYPGQALYSELNLLGSHDRERLFTTLGGAPNPDTLSESERASYRLDPGQRNLAKSRLWAITLLQMTLPGVPCIYYGDERGMEGFRDPYNRAAYPWDGGDKDCFDIYRNAIAVRKTLDVLVDGRFNPFAVGDDVFGFWRRSRTKSDCACVLVNASLNNSHTVRVPIESGMEVSDIVSGRDPKVSQGQAEVFLWPLGTAVLHFHRHERLQKPLERGMGVLCHVTSVPNNGKPGTLGAPAKRFVDWLASCGQRYWQVLPVNPTDEFGSPYAGLAANAGNVSLLERDPEEVLADDILFGDGRFAEFCDDNDYWLTPYATFCALKDKFDGAPWQAWPEQYRSYSPRLADDPELAPGIETARKLQFEFQQEWNELRVYANERGVRIVGDMPMYVSADSADVWSEPDIFDLDEDGHAAMQAGAPADQLSAEGQLWGNPTYDWDVLRSDGYDWWLRRLDRAFKLYDYVRLDHFIGFSSYFEIEAGKPATEGAYAFGPGTNLFRAANKLFGGLPLIAEDLGNVTPAVRALIAETGVPGMSIVQFADQDVRNEFTPNKGSVVYTGTHDTETLVGWCTRSFADGDAEKAVELARDIERRTAGVENDVVIMPLQDVLLLGNEARMNVPGVAEGNWTWQANAANVEAATSWLRELADESGRAVEG